MRRIGKVHIEFLAAGAALLILVLLLMPRPITGVADNGDFERIMNSTGLYYLSDNPSDRYFGFVNRLYGIGPVKPFGGGYFSTEIPLVLLAVCISKIMPGTVVLDIRFLSAIYILLLVTAVYFISRSCRICFGNLAGLLSGIFAALIFCDIGYTSYFNSLYGEPVTVVFLLLMTAMALWLATAERHRLLALIVFGISLVFFCGAKLQNSPSGLLAGIFCIRLASYGRGGIETGGSRPGYVRMGTSPGRWRSGTKEHYIGLEPGSAKVVRLWTGRGAGGAKSSGAAWRALSLAFAIMTALVFLACLNVSKDIRTCNKYQTVFYGILRNSPDPAGDLEELGLAPSLAVLANTNYFMEKYPIDIRNDGFTEMIYDKVSYLKIMEFYLHHPARFTQKLEAAAENGFKLKQGFGNYEKDVKTHYRQTSNAFGFWSDFKMKVLPHSLLFVFLFYFTALLILVFCHIRADNTRIRLFIEFMGLIVLMGVMQFMLPLLGDGEADLSKHLFLFNACFDLLFGAGLTYLIKQAVVLVSRLWGRFRSAGLQTE